MNHKRRRPKNRRSGCLMCKAYKINGARPRAKVTVATLRRIGRSEEEK